MYCFFFQAEDGIRDGHVTGVQTCALPISRCDEERRQDPPAPRPPGAARTTRAAVPPDRRVLTCRGLVARLTDLSCGDLTLSEERESKRHLARCESCASYWRTYRTTVALERQAYREPDAGWGEMPAELA